MKRNLTILAIAILGLIAFAGCSKKSSSPSYSMKATIGTTNFSANYALATNTSGLLSISGWNGSGSTATPPYFDITIYNYVAGTTTYKIDTTSFTPTVAASFWKDASLSDIVAAKTGTVTITSSSSSSISGTFSFVNTDGTSTTGGTFTAKMQ